MSRSRIRTRRRDHFPESGHAEHSADIAPLLLLTTAPPRGKGAYGSTAGLRIAKASWEHSPARGTSFRSRIARARRSPPRSSYPARIRRMSVERLWKPGLPRCPSDVGGELWHASMSACPRRRTDRSGLRERATCRRLPGCSLNQDTRTMSRMFARDSSVSTDAMTQGCSLPRSAARWSRSSPTN